MAEQETPSNHLCSFCGKPNTLCEKMIAGPKGANICNECVDVCIELLGKKAPGPENTAATGQSHADNPEISLLKEQITGLQNRMRILEKLVATSLPVAKLPEAEKTRPA